MADPAKVNQAGRKMVSELSEELIALREAVATHLRYLDGEIIDGLRTNRHTPEVAANIGEQQSGNLRRAVERTGKLTPDGYAGALSSSGRPTVIEVGNRVAQKRTHEKGTVIGTTEDSLLIVAWDGFESDPDPTVIYREYVRRVTAATPEEAEDD